MPLLQSHVVTAVIGGGAGGGAFLVATVSGLPADQLLQFNIAVNLAMFALILRNTAQISKLAGRFDATHD